MSTNGFQSQSHCDRYQQNNKTLVRNKVCHPMKFEVYGQVELNLFSGNCFSVKVTVTFTFDLLTTKTNSLFVLYKVLSLWLKWTLSYCGKITVILIIDLLAQIFSRIGNHSIRSEGSRWRNTQDIARKRSAIGWQSHIYIYMKRQGKYNVSPRVFDVIYIISFVQMTCRT